MSWPIKLFKTLCFLALLIAGSGAAHAQERIISFDSEIFIKEDGRLQVKETITVYAMGAKIKRGIYRDFPTKYKTRDGRTVRVPFKVLSVRRDSKSEPYHLESMSNGKRVYIGSSDVMISRGQHTYIITYETDRQLGYFSEHDELYWNVVGQGWDFPVEFAKATVHLPSQTQILDISAYTGRYGATGSDFTIVSNGLPVKLHTTKQLLPGAGFTISVSWPKGIVTPPTQSEVWIDDHGAMVIGWIGFLVLGAFYYRRWHVIGRDPEKGTIIPLFHPPDKLSPAALRYIEERGLDQTGVTAALISMAVKGHLKIKDRSGGFVLFKAGDQQVQLSKGEQSLAGELFRFHDSVDVDQENHKRFSAAEKAFEGTLRDEYTGEYFRLNRQTVVIGAVGSIIFTFIGLSGFQLSDFGTLFFFSFFLPAFGVPVFLHTKRGLSLAQNAASGVTRWVGIRALLASGPTTGIFIWVLFVTGQIFVEQVMLGGIALIVAFLALNAVFYKLMEAPTVGGRALLDKVEGFRMYLETAEQERLDLLHPPEKTPELFEKYLPYAVALGVETQWAEQFTGVFALAADAGTPYEPDWYDGNRLNRRRYSDFTSSLSSSMSSSISSASSPPGSSSGSGGGGFSGGGGGGGGGGGW